MNLLSFKQFLVEIKISKTKLDYHEVLNPKLWTDENELVPKVKDQLKKIADTFIDYLDIEKQFISEIVFTGSNTNYNYTDQSDIDIHITADFKKLKGKIKPEDYFDAMKSNWNLTHNIKIYGHDVELYVNDKKENLVGDSSAYSLKHNKWIKKPELKVAKYPSAMIKLKASHLANLIDKNIKLHHNDKEDLEKLNTKLWKIRTAGLSKQGEFSLENLVFKALRNNGYIDKLRKQIKKAEDNKLNLESIMNENEKYKGYTIQPITKRIDKKNKISGHEWAEYEETVGFNVYGKGALSSNKYKTVKSAKEYIDFLIKFGVGYE